ncbi:hypothetical protein NCG89_06620 [Spongiibacter taiwanensis]|uniref:DUF883 family protein n=1 Tax=Spongiibacter taiwanensis TaxID=1748242 RepID=UPI00203565E8|nr:hypothetical protein [Spongiibacter taiwanensis]USA44442.1 hypothetical protein NCG89_06620 [Spongiibacter taiwanensis]
MLNSCLIMLTEMEVATHQSFKDVVYPFKNEALFVRRMTMAVTNTSEHHDSHNEHIDSLARRAHEAVDRAAKMAGSSEERILRLADELRSQAEQMGSSAKQRSEKITSSVEDYTRAHPIKTLSFAFVLGALLTFLLRK